MKQGKGRRKTYEESGKDKYETLKGELKKLRKEVLQLRKENARLRGRDEAIADLFDNEEAEIMEIINQISCPKCGSKNVKVMEKLQNGKDYYFCENTSCGARGPL